MAFRFKDKERPRGYTSKLGGMLHVSVELGFKKIVCFVGFFLSSLPLLFISYSILIQQYDYSLNKCSYLPKVRCTS